MITNSELFNDYYINQMSVISKAICSTKLLFSKKAISTFYLTYQKSIQIAFMVTIIIPFNPGSFWKYMSFFRKMLFAIFFSYGFVITTFNEYELYCWCHRFRSEEIDLVYYKWCCNDDSFLLLPCDLFPPGLLPLFSRTW